MIKCPLLPQIQGELNSKDHINLLTGFVIILNLSLKTDLSLCNPLLCSRSTMKAAIFPFEIIQSRHVSLWGDLLCLIQAPRQYITESQGKGSNFLPLIHGNEIPYPRRLWWSNSLPLGRQTCQMPKVSPGGDVKAFIWLILGSFIKDALQSDSLNCCLLRSEGDTRDNCHYQNPTSGLL